MEKKGNSDSEVVLLLKKIEIGQKQFCFKFKENSQTQYLLVSHNDYSILVPSNSIPCFLHAFDSCCFGNGKRQQQHKGVSKIEEFQINGKVFCFEIGKNIRGRFLKVSAASIGEDPNYIMIPSGGNGDDGWELFRRTIAETDKTARLFFPPTQKKSVPSEGSEELANTKADFITGDNAENSAESQLDIEPLENECGGVRDSKMMKVGQKRFFFDIGVNRRGGFLKISEVVKRNRFFIIIPLPELKQFHEMVGYFLESPPTQEKETK